MEIMLYGRVAPSKEIHVWLGVSNCTALPSASWKINGIPISPTPLIDFRPIRNNSLVNNPNNPRTYFGLFKFDNLTSRTQYQVEANFNGKIKRLSIRPMPEEIPEEGFHVLLSSCFHGKEASHGKIEYMVDTVKKYCPLGGPNMTILLGDQVYLDLPTFEDFPSGKKALAEKFEKKYLNNWGENSLTKLLSAAPFVAIADDHEYWNNYPHWSPHIGNSWSEKGRKNWTAAADAMYEGFQSSYNSGTGLDANQPTIITIPPISFFIVNTRSGREENTFMPPNGLSKLNNWIRETNANSNIKVAIFVTGQSLYRKKASGISGKIADKELPNYTDFKDLVTSLTKIQEKLICITGDVHWGRVVESVSVDNHIRGNAYEIIVSPSALVTTPIVDTFNSLKFWKKWPRHGNPEEEEDMGAFANGVEGIGKPYNDPKIKTGEGNGKAMLKGDQIALLSFFNYGAKFTARVQYWNIDHNPEPSLQVNLF